MSLEVVVTDDYERMSEISASILISEIRRVLIEQQRIFNFGLATGNSPLGLYNLLVRRQDELNITSDTLAKLVERHDGTRVLPIRSWNLDEYAGLPEMDPRSYKFQMEQNLFGQLNPRFAETNIPKGWRMSEEELEKILSAGEGFAEFGQHSGKSIEISDTCQNPYLIFIRDELLREYLASIRKAGGIDWQVAGVGRNGHIAFHESGIPLRRRIMLVKLSEETRNDAVEDGNFTREDVPNYALSLGVGCFANGDSWKYCRNVLVLASGERKTEAVANGLLGHITNDVPISYLQAYTQLDKRRAVFVLDEIAAAGILGHERELKEKGITVKDLRKQALVYSS